MKLYSTNHSSPDVSFKEAIFQGLPPDNGLYMPYKLPKLEDSFFKSIDELSFQEMAFEVAQKLIGDEIPEKELKDIIDGTLSFEVPIVNIESQVNVLELIHGPSHAFKDFGARFMARTMGHFLQGEDKEINILVATSGDTGGAVAMGFLNTPGIKVTILYPSGKVSDLQEKQLTALGGNITALEVDGTFDDCQRMVKSAFLDEEIRSKVNLSSANSINIARLIPQSFYYYYAYAQMKPKGKEVVFCTPSGNFGNIVGGMMAQKMGLPVKKFIAATNINDVVPEYLQTGEFRPRPSQRTISNAMDVGNPSNFVRLSDLYNKDLESTQNHVEGYAFTDEETRLITDKVYDDTGYIMCPHTAIGYLGIKKYFENSPSDAEGIFLSTAHPAKFVNEMDEKYADKIEIPSNLKTLLDKKKISIKVSNEFEDLKSFLL